MGRHLEVHHKEVMQQIETIGALVTSPSSVRYSSSYLDVIWWRAAPSVHMMHTDCGGFLPKFSESIPSTTFGTARVRLRPAYVNCVRLPLPTSSFKALLRSQLRVHKTDYMHMIFRTKAYVDAPMPLRSCPKIFHGRDRELGRLLDVVCTDSPTRVAVLGPGGVGG